MDLVPGPGYYEKQYVIPNNEYENEDQKIKSCFIPKGEKKTFPEGLSQGVPGPAYYEYSLEPKKISFLFNASQKWVNQ